MDMIHTGQFLQASHQAYENLLIINHVVLPKSPTNAGIIIERLTHSRLRQISMVTSKSLMTLYQAPPAESLSAGNPVPFCKLPHPSKSLQTPTDALVVLEQSDCPPPQQNSAHPPRLHE
jgi:hypothetical protein